MTAAIQKIFKTMRTAQKAEPVVTRETRLEWLERLATSLLAHEEELISAMSDDFSHRSAVESRVFDIDVTLAEIRHAKRHLRRWMRVRRVGTPLTFMPARGEIRPQPLGVVGIIAPWNFPVQLSLAPMVAALAAGNRVMLKPSELTPRTSQVLAEMLHNTFHSDEVAVVQGDAEVAAAFSALPFDHLFFTGSTAVGRKVAQAAATNLTPVTLELGGKSPAVIMPSANLDRAGKRIAWGKTANAGQICVAPDYVLVPRKKMDMVADTILGAMMGFYRKGPISEDYSAIVSDRHLSRLTAMVDEARARGCEVLTLDGDLGNTRKFAPTLVLDPPEDIALMREEIFGPVLPIVPYDTPNEALRYVTSRDHPLALYVFADERSEADLWLDNTLSGGVTVNDTVIHVGFGTLPFGGVGPSGMGAYHGDAGFETFSHMKSVVRQPKWNPMFITEAPFKGWKKRLLMATRKLR